MTTGTRPSDRRPLRTGLSQTGLALDQGRTL
ncbi:MAG: hypothetical protein RIT46_687, partial [Pseudomonadota bacterium]